MHHIVKRGTSLPTRKSYTFTTVGDGQDTVTIKIWRGERPIASQNFFMGELPPLPVRSGKAGDAQVCFFQPLILSIRNLMRCLQIEVRIDVDQAEEWIVVSLSLTPSTLPNLHHGTDKQCVQVSAFDPTANKSSSYTINMREREQVSGRDYDILERHIEEWEKHANDDQLLKSQIQAEVEASLAKPGGREKAENGWEIVEKKRVIDVDEL